jgi:hypothetical protein
MKGMAMVRTYALTAHLRTSFNPRENWWYSYILDLEESGITDDG